MKAKSTYKLKATVWLYPGVASAWHFVTLPQSDSAELSVRYWHKRRGWGSLRVQATIGKTRWTTSIFFDTKANAFLLPIKADVRRKERIRAGDTVAFKVEVI